MLEIYGGSCSEFYNWKTILMTDGSIGEQCWEVVDFNCLLQVNSTSSCIIGNWLSNALTFLSSDVFFLS